MEKRLLLAVFLSLFVLYLWAGLTQPQRSSFDTKKLSQPIDNKEIIEISPPSLSEPAPLEASTQETPISTQEEFTTLENNRLTITFSNIGGSIYSAYIKEHDVELPIENLGAISGYENVAFRLDNSSYTTVTYSYLSSDFRIVVTYQISDDDYTVKQNTYVQNISEMSKLAKLKVNSLTINANRLDINGDNGRDKSLNEYVVNSYAGIHRKNNAFKFADKESKNEEGHVVWTGYRDRYYCAIYKPDFKSKGYEIDAISDKELSVNIILNNQTLEGGKAINLSSLIFIGPERRDILRSYDLGLEKIKKFYRFGLFDIIAMIIYNFMHFVHKYVPNWGWSIVIVSVIIYFSMYPLTLRGMSSMKRMQAMQPEISKLKEKYKDNPQKMNQEMMKLYKENKINPIGGCLPFLLQMPIFIGLYQVLWRSVSFKGASFMWIDDLSQPDRFYILPFKLPFMGNELNLLPLLMMIIMFFQQRITSKNMTVTDPMQKQQQKMMGIFMPIFLGVIFYKFASGLTLYFTMFYIFSTFTQYKMYKQKKAA